MILPIQILTETPLEWRFGAAFAVASVAAIAIRLAGRRAARRRAKRAPWKSAVYNPKEFRRPR